MMTTVFQKLLVIAGMPAEKAYAWLNGLLQNPEETGIWICLVTSFIFIVASTLCALLCEKVGILFGPAGPIVHHHKPKAGVVLLRVAVFAVLFLIHFATYRVATGYMVAAIADFSLVGFWAMFFVPAVIVGTGVFLLFFAFV